VAGSDFLGFQERLTLGAGLRPGLFSPSSRFLCVFMFDTLTKQDLRYCVARYGPFFEPIFYAVDVKDDLFGGVLLDWVVVAELFDDSAIPRRAQLDGVDSEERSMPSAHSGHSDFYCHNFSFLKSFMINFRDFTHQSRNTFTMEDVAVDEDCEVSGVDTGIGGNLLYLVIGKFVGRYLFRRCHYGYCRFKLLELLNAGGGQHCQLTVALIVLELASYHFAVIAAGEFGEPVEVFLD
jgi:hypothetical protein